jgi:NADH-quinone oxidoreductase subunit C
MAETLVQFVERLQARFPQATVTVAQPRGEVGIEFPNGDWLLGCEALRDECGVDYLGYGSDEWNTDVSSEGFSRGVEGRGVGRFKYGETTSRQSAQFEDQAIEPLPQRRYAAVAQLLSVQHNRRIRVKAFAPNDDLPVVASLTGIWPVANWFEREAFDLFGIIFEGHPDLRRILTDYGFVGHPFRKDFPLIGNVEVRYDEQRKRVVYEPVTSVEPRVGVPRVIRDDARFATASGESAARRAEASK